MSHCKQEGKDKIIFVTEDDHNTPTTVKLAEEEEKDVGVIRSNGTINWDCPCLGGMQTGPCGLEFREAFSCFHYSKETPQGSDCLEPFKTMSSCMAQFPGVYGSNNDEDKDSEEKDITKLPSTEVAQNSDDSKTSKS